MEYTYQTAGFKKSSEFLNLPTKKANSVGSAHIRMAYFWQKCHCGGKNGHKVSLEMRRIEHSAFSTALVRWHILCAKRFQYSFQSHFLLQSRNLGYGEKRYIFLLACFYNLISGILCRGDNFVAWMDYSIIIYMVFSESRTSRVVKVGKRSEVHCENQI